MFIQMCLKTWLVSALVTWRLTLRKPEHISFMDRNTCVTLWLLCYWKNKNGKNFSPRLKGFFFQIMDISYSGADREISVVHLVLKFLWFLWKSAECGHVYETGTSCLSSCLCCSASVVCCPSPHGHFIDQNVKQETNKKKKLGYFFCWQNPASHSRSATETSIDFDLLTYWFQHFKAFTPVSRESKDLYLERPNIDSISGRH